MIQWHFQGGISPPLALHSAKRRCGVVIYLTHQVVTEASSDQRICSLFERNGLDQESGMFKRS